MTGHGQSRPLLRTSRQRKLARLTSSAWGLWFLLSHAAAVRIEEGYLVLSQEDLAGASQHGHLTPRDDVKAPQLGGHGSSGSHSEEGHETPGHETPGTELGNGDGIHAGEETGTTRRPRPTRRRRPAKGPPPEEGSPDQASGHEKDESSLQADHQHASRPPPPQKVLDEIQNQEAAESKVALLIAFMLLGFLVFDIGLLYLVNSSDPQVKSYSYKLLSNVVVVFSALSIEALHRDVIQWALSEICAVFGVVYDRHESLLDELVVLVFFLAWFFSISRVAWYLRKRHEDSFGALGLLAHVAAFLVLEKLGELQQEVAEEIVHKSSHNKSAHNLAAHAFIQLLQVVPQVVAHTEGSTAAPPADQPHAGDILGHDSDHETTCPECERSVGTYHPGVIALYVLTPVAVVAFIRACSMVTKRWRRRMIEIQMEECLPHSESMLPGSTGTNADAEPHDHQGVPSRPVNRLTVAISEEAADESGHHGGHTWVHDVFHSETDVSAITVGFLLKQFIAHLLTGNITPFDCNEHPVRCMVPGRMVLQMAIPATLIYLAVIFCSILQERRGHWKPLMRFQLVLGYTLAWVCLHWGIWITTYLTEELTKTSSVWRASTAKKLVTAAVFTPFYMLIIIAVDKLADFGILDSLWAEASIQNVALLIGLYWEKAFGSAIAYAVWSIDTNKEWMGILVEFLVEVAFLSLILPAWRWFIVPTACQPVPERSLDIERKAEQVFHNMATAAHQRRAAAEGTSAEGEVAQTFDEEHPAKHAGAGH